MTDASQRLDLPVGSIGRHANGWWGMMMLIVTEGALFVYLLFAYYYAAVQHSRDWLPAGPSGLQAVAPRHDRSAFEQRRRMEGRTFAETGPIRRRRGGLFGVAALMGIVFVAVQAVEWAGKKFTPFSSSYGSLYFTITGFHMLHVVAGVLILPTLALVVRAWLLQSHSQRAGQHRRHLLAFCRRHLARAFLHLLHHAATGARLSP